MAAEKEYEVHPAAELFPMIGKEELQQLADDIKTNGLMEPISLYNERILDGRNRLAACRLAGVEPRFETVNLNGTLPTVWIISKNLLRRHLTTSQRAAIAAEAYPLVQEDTLARQREQLDRGRNIRNGIQVPAKLPEPETSNQMNKMRGEARHITGQAMHVGARTVQTARAVKAADPEMFERVKRGEVTLGAADRKVRKEVHRKPILVVPARSESITKHQRMVDDAAKRRMISGLSQMQGAARGLSGMKMTSLLRVLSSEELQTWTGIANEIARQLRDFARALKEHEVA